MKKLRRFEILFKKQQKTDIFGFTNICSFAKDLLARTLNVVGFRKQSNDFQSALTDWYHWSLSIRPEKIRKLEVF